MFRSLSKLFSAATGEPAKGRSVVPEILNLTIGRVAELDPLLLRVMGGESKLAIPSPTLEIVAQGMIALEDGSFVHRLYTEQHVMVQIVSTARDSDGDVTDVTLFAPLESFYPSRDAEFRQWTQRIGKPRFTLADGTVYRRFWFANSDQPEDPVQLIENIHDDRHSGQSRQIHQTCMLFHRPLSAGMNEMLLCSIESTGDERTVELMVGIPLSPAQITV